LAAPDEDLAASGSARSGADDTPVQDDELDALFASLAPFRLLVLAVSGGADSMALMLLVSRWARSCRETGKIIVASVDHGLRDSARAEAAWVVSEARDLGFEATVLTWSGDKPATGVQDSARTARYRLLAELARTAGVGPAAIVTAHTEDDQAETLLMRLARGSGLDGLAAMPTVRAADALSPEIALLRPLLGIPGARLRATLRAACRAWIEDPSNDAERFERVRVRKARPVLTELGISNDKLALSARRLARAKAAIEAAVDALELKARLDVHDGAYASFDAAAWRGAPEELRLRLLGRLITAFGGQVEPLRLAQLEALVARMSHGGFEGATLSGAVISPHGAAVHVEREAGRAALPTVTLAPGASAIWDHRFRVEAARESPGPVEVHALGAQAYTQLRRQLDADLRLPAGVAATLPAFWRSGELLFVPALARCPAAQTLWDKAGRLYSAEFLG